MHINFFFLICLFFYILCSYKIFIKGSLRILSSNNSIDGITIHLTNKFIKYKVHAQGIYLNVNFESVDSVKSLIERYKSVSNLYCNLNKNNEEEVIDGDILRTNNCVIFINIKYKDHLKNIYDFMEYLYLNTSAAALIFICDNFLYENEIYDPHEDLNLTIIQGSILTYFISYDSISHYEKKNFYKYTFELYWGVNKKTDIVHIIYHLDFGKYFNYSFFIYMKDFFLELKNHLTYEIQFSIHKNFTIDPRFCFIRDSSYCISKPDYMNSNVVREVVEQQVRSLCIYELTLIDDDDDESQENTHNKNALERSNYNLPNSNKVSYLNYYNTTKKEILKEQKKKMFSEKYIHYINALFDFTFEKNYCSNESNDLTKKCSDKILSFLNISVKDVDNCFLNNFHTYMKNMIKSKFYVYSIEINDKIYKIKLNKDISIKLICSAFKSMPYQCKDYLTNQEFELENKKENSDANLIAFAFLFISISVHIIGSFLNYLVPKLINEKKK
ncbi:conserved Plasmodium protein, unknown function [Plasmodium relictum]|uniref:Uncharacterized protein n=1 Tax=Plasmodium relictum TaxID=85471 RepID=A0A1J1HBT9_PLARL|nr:conserved Plasmodium protein, unknown function [Plasmodium relictum]CRH02875.1 conserved Plasmodium protein, unknown function [Plasmodium relictum]